MRRTEELVLGGKKYEVQELLATDRIKAGLFILGSNGDLLNSGDPEKVSNNIRELVNLGLKFPRFRNKDDYDEYFCEHFAHLPEVIEKIIDLNFGEVYEKIKKKYL
jgi:hypothetical protein